MKLPNYKDMCVINSKDVTTVLAISYLILTSYAFLYLVHNFHRSLILGLALPFLTNVLGFELDVHTVQLRRTPILH